MTIHCPKALNDLNMFDNNNIITCTIKSIAHRSWRCRVLTKLFSKFAYKDKITRSYKIIVITKYDKYTYERLLV